MDDWKSKLKMRLPAFVLLLATTLFWMFYDRYEPAGPVLLSSPALADATRSSGEVSESGGRFILSVPESGKRAEVRFRLSAAIDYSMIRVRARMRTDGVVEGRYSWRCARLLLAQYGSDNKWISGDHGVVSERGTKDWEWHEDVFEIFPGAAYADVLLLQAGTSGRAEFEHIEAQPVRVRTSFMWWRILFAGAWLVMAVYYFPRCRLHRRRLKVLVLLNVIAILSGALLPGDWIDDRVEKARSTWANIMKPVPVEADAPPAAKPQVKQYDDSKQMDRFSKLVGDTHRTGHFVLFASLCLLVYLSAALERQHPFYFFKVGFDVLLFAAVTEALQLLTLDRTGSVHDLLVDFCGMLVAISVFIAMLPFVRRIRLTEGFEV